VEFNPTTYDISCYNKPYSQMIKRVAEEIKYGINSRFLLNIDHADGDAMSIVLFPLLFDMIEKKDYRIGVWNGTHHLSFSSSIFPSSIVKEELRKGNPVTFVTIDNTPWSIFWEQVLNFYEKLSDVEKKKLKIVVIDHHPYVEEDKLSWVKKFEKEGETKECPKTIYINAGWSEETTRWYVNKANVPCAGEISFDVTHELIEHLYPEKSTAFLERAVTPLLVATETDMRTPSMTERYEGEINRRIKSALNWTVHDNYRGEVSIPTRFVNKANGAIRVSGILVDRPIYSVMNEDQIHVYPTHRVLGDIAKALYFATINGDIKLLIIEPQKTGVRNHSTLPTIIKLDEEHRKITPQIRKAFLEWIPNSGYVPREDVVLKVEDTGALICFIPGDTSIKYKGKFPPISSSLKIPPYMLFFLTEYRHIANSEIVSSSSFVVAAVEGVPNEPESYVQFSLRVPEYKKYPYPLGRIAEGIAKYFKEKYNATSVDVQGGGHPTAAGIRIKQRIFNEFMREVMGENDRTIDKFDAINEILKRSKV